VRRIVLANLPAEVELKDIFCILWGGRVESVRYTKGESTCTVLFLTTEACKSYCLDAAAGVQWPHDRQRVITIESIEELEQNEFEAGLVGTKVSRCVRVANLSPDISSQVLRAVATQGDRVVERILSGKLGAVSNSAMTPANI
jgi:hypothetical protein